MCTILAVSKTNCFVPSADILDALHRVRKLDTDVGLESAGDKRVIYMELSTCCQSPTTLPPQNKAFCLKNDLRPPQNNPGGCWNQAYYFQHQKLPLYAQSRELFNTGHGRPSKACKQIPLCFISINFRP